MLRVDLRRDRAGVDGVSLALAVHDPAVPTRVLLPGGARLSESKAAGLWEAGVRWAWVHCPAVAGLVAGQSEHAGGGEAMLAAAVGGAFDAARDRVVVVASLSEYTAAVERVVEGALEAGGPGLYLGQVQDAADGLLGHSAAVAYLSVLMGLRLEGYLVRQRPHVPASRAAELVDLGLGAMLHDVGLTRLPAELRRLEAPTGGRAARRWSAHPAIGFETVRRAVSPAAATVVLHHHQRVDGSGFAGADHPVLNGQQVHVLARIVAVADVFDRLRRPGGLEARPTVWALGAMVRGAMAGGLDRVCLRALLEVVPPYPPGTRVGLSDGREAVVVEHRADDPCRPVVEVVVAGGATRGVPDASPPLAAQRRLRGGGGPPTPEGVGFGGAGVRELVRGRSAGRVDLARQPASLRIEEHEGQAVGGMNFGRAAVARLAG
jgi:HD-GYP domain-containing protein (c-di-GMP phosphodiesterase class II)